METPETSDAPGATSIDSDIAADAVSNAPLPDTPPRCPAKHGRGAGHRGPACPFSTLGRSPPTPGSRRDHRERRADGGRRRRRRQAGRDAHAHAVLRPRRGCHDGQDPRQRHRDEAPSRERVRRRSKCPGSSGNGSIGLNADATYSTSHARAGRHVTQRPATSREGDPPALTRAIRPRHASRSRTRVRGRRPVRVRWRTIILGRIFGVTGWHDADAGKGRLGKHSDRSPAEPPRGVHRGAHVVPVARVRRRDDGATWTDEDDDDDDDESRSETDSIMPLPVKRSTHVPRVRRTVPRVDSAHVARFEAYPPSSSAATRAAAVHTASHSAATRAAARRGASTPRTSLNEPP